MTVTVYKSTDGSAPTLTGAVGSLTTLLDAVLVNGYGAKSAAGWTIGQTTTNKRQYVQGSGSTGFSLWVDDTAVTTAKEARCSGYQTMSATTPTGTGQFPTSGQSTIGTGMLAIRKSTTADAAARVWMIVADATVFYLWTETGDATGPTAAFSFMFGDIFTYGPSDTSNCLIIGRQIENTAAPGSSSTIYEGFPNLSRHDNTTILSGTLNGHYMAASFTNVGGSVAVGKHTDQTKMGFNSSNVAGLLMGFLGNWSASQNNATNVNTFNYPNGPDQGLYMAPCWIHHGGNVRGYLKGIWCPLQHLPLTHGDTFSGTGNLSGKSFQAIALASPQPTPSTVGYASQCFVETSNTWS